ncbi:MAG: glycosyltransferase family 4 protein [Minisyncoccia bacterium]
MKVLMFGWEFPPYNSGGLGTACYGITKALSGKGVEINFVIPRDIKIREGFLNVISTKLPKIKIREIDSLLVSYMTSQNYRRRFLSLDKNYQDNIYCKNLIEEVYRYALVARNIAAEVDHEIIHCHDWMTFPAGIAAKNVSKKPMIAHVHSTEYDRSAGHGVNPEVYKIEREGIQMADKVIAVSRFTKDRIVKNYNIDERKVEVVYNAINKDEFFSNSNCKNQFNGFNKKIVLFLGRLTLHKGPDYFLSAAKKVLERNNNVIFIIAGSGDMEHQIIEQASEMGIADRVLFTGFLRNNELRKIYRMANLYVMPSVSEPFGITPLESIASGTPVIISKQSGISEVLDHCLKVDFWDTDEMANKILSVLANEELEDCLSGNSMKEIDKLRWDISADKIIEIYNKLHCSGCCT